MRFHLVVAFAVLAVFSVLEVGSQPSQPGISMSAIPSWGQDGVITGSIYGTAAQQVSLYLFAFVPDLGWVGVPSNCVPATVQSGQFSVSTSSDITLRSATRFTAYLLPASLTPQCNTGTATTPFIIQHNAIASASLPRLPQFSTISFGGLDWYVKDAPVQVYPGPQFFLQNNAFVDSQGQLHLRITPCGGSWCAAEVYTKQVLGYGTYRFTVNSQINNLDPNVALGLFSWDAQAGDQYNREWDIEFSRWGNASATANAQYVVQPYDGPRNIQHFLMGSASPSTHVISWTPAQVGFVSSTATTNPVSQWTYTGAGADIPTPGDVHLHLNFYVAAGKPSVPGTQEVIISAFQYQPSGPQVGFSRLADTLTYQQQSTWVPLTPTSSSCSASVESDSPWLSVVGSTDIPAGAAVQYSVSANLGNSRSGNLILRSTTCNATLGAQALTVTQAGLVCAPNFAVPSTHIGFLQTVFSVNILGTAPVCDWTVNSSAPWLSFASGASGSGDGTVQVAAGGNTDPSLRGAVLSLSNGPIHSVYQDAYGSLLALSPLIATSCAGQSATFGLSWVAPTNVEFHLNLPTGGLVGQFGPTGTTSLVGIADGTLIFMVQSPAGSQPSTLASARASVNSSNCNGASIAPLGPVNAASYSANSLAPAALASVFGTNLSTATMQATGGVNPTTLAGVSVLLAGQPCPLWYVSPGQINFAVPATVPPGRYTLTVGAGTSDVLITSVSPGIFTVKGDGTGVPLATVIGVRDDGTTVPFTPYQCSAGACTIAPILLPDRLSDLYIVLYGTGIRNYHSIHAALGSLVPEVVYVGAQGQYAGLDQVNLHLKAPVSPSGLQSLRLQVDGILSNAVSILFQ